MATIDDLSGVTRGPRAAEQAAANRVAEQLVSRKRDADTPTKPVAATEESRMDSGQETTNAPKQPYSFDVRV